MDYQVALDTFHGPLDLLLYLVRRHEIDILDIPIARVTEQFLAYLEILQSIDVEAAGDFLVVAASLMEIKSRLLLPQEEKPSDTEEDPRTELVRQLLEYRRFREASEYLEQANARQLTHHFRDPIPEEDSGNTPNIQRVELWDLVSAFSRLMRETLALTPLQVIVDETPMHVYQEEILEGLKSAEERSFREMLRPPWHRSRLIGLFLAVLELIRGGRIWLEMSESSDDFRLRLRSEPLDQSSLPNNRDSDSENPLPGT